MLPPGGRRYDQAMILKFFGPDPDLPRLGRFSYELLELLEKTPDREVENCTLENSK